MDLSKYTDIEKRLAAAKQMLEKGERAKGIDLLKGSLLSHPDDPRAKEMLRNLGITYLPEFMAGHSSRVTRLDWSPDGKVLASLDCDSTVRIWEATGFTEIHSFRRHHLGMVKFCPDSQKLLMVSQGTEVQVWDTGNFVQEREVTVGWVDDTEASDGMPSVYGVDDIQFSPDGRLAAFCCGTKKIKVLDARDLTEIKTLDFDNYLISNIALSADGKFLAVTTGQGVSVWETKNWELKYGLTEKGAVYGLDWSGDGKFLAALAGQEVAVWDFAKKKLLKSLPFAGEFTAARFGPGAARLAVASGNTIKIWDGPDFEWSKEIQTGTPEDRQASLSWSPDGGRLALGQWDGTIKIWDSNSGQFVSQANGRCGQFLCSWGPAGHMALASGSGLITIVEDEGLTKAKALTIGQYGQPRALCWSPDGRYLACAAEQDKVKIWEAPEFEKTKYVKGALERNILASLAWSRDGRLFAYGSHDEVRLYRAENASLEKAVKLPGWDVYSLDFSPDGKRLAVGSDTKNKTEILDLDSGDEIQSLPGRLGLWSQDGRLFISASRDIKFKILDGQTFAALREITTNYTPDKVQWSPDGKLVLTAADDKLLAFEAETGNAVAIPQALSWRINDFCWAPDSKRVLACNSDEAAVVTIV